MGRTIVEKIWADHVVHRGDSGEPDLLYVDLHLVHEVSSPQAFDGLRSAGRPVRRPDLTLATMDHNVPTDPLMVRGEVPHDDPASVEQIEALRRNCRDFGVPLFPMGSLDQGIVHVIGPELGLSQPGMVIVCGDSHTSTHGALGALAFGIGTSEVEHVLATQTLPQRPPRTMAVEIVGTRAAGTTAKDLILRILNVIGVDGGRDHVVEYRGQAIGDLSMEERMTVCNMTIEGGARAGVIAPDETTFAYLEGRPYAPVGEAWQAALSQWRQLASDPDATFDRTVQIDASSVAPYVTWGTTPAQSVPITAVVPDPANAPDEMTADQWRRALEYQGLRPGMAMTDVHVDKVFIGSCTNARLTDLRAAAEVIRGRRLAEGVTALVVPGSGSVKRAAEAEGLHRIFEEAGFQWREPGCSMCLGMNPDVVQPGERCASTSNRNFEGRQGPRSRTHLVSPAMAAAAAIHGRFVDVRDDVEA